MHRLTQTVDVIVYKLTVKGTVEERILELQEKKRLLAMHAIEGGMKKNKDSLKLSLQDLLNLFKPRGDGGGDNGSAHGGPGGDDDDALNGLADFRSKKPSAPKKAPRREDDVYGRRW